MPVMNPVPFLVLPPLDAQLYVPAFVVMAGAITALWKAVEKRDERQQHNFEKQLESNYTTAKALDALAEKFERWASKNAS